MTKPASERRRPLADVREPTYVPSGRRGQLYAHFRSGLIVRAGRERVRSYPGLRGAAPPTLAIYEVLKQLPPSTHVLDLGSGAGIGTRRLTTHFDAVTAVDSSSEALAFAREYAPLARYVHTDACESLPDEEYGAVAIVDVLGHVASPELALVNLRSRLRHDAVVLVAEPRASTVQRLEAPARRAYSPAELVALLTRSGFVVKEWVMARGSFVSCLARVDRSEESANLCRGLACLRAGQLDAALAALSQATDGPHLVAIEAQLARAYIHLERRDGDASVRCFLRASELDPADARPTAGLAEIALRTRDIASAVRLSTTALSNDPTCAPAAHILALAAEELDPSQAVIAWQRAHDLAPDDLGTASGLAQAAVAQQNAKLAIRAYERLRSYGADHGVDFNVTLAWLLIADGRSADAEMEARVAHAKAPHDAAVIELRRTLSEKG
jgi:2-polyprenyl-3-methyl-5-hydroxy-6-metoxy-1,4-benzoquinol methylase